MWCERLCLFPFYRDRAVYKDHIYLYIKRDFFFFSEQTGQLVDLDICLIKSVLD